MNDELEPWEAIQFFQTQGPHWTAFLKAIEDKRDWWSEKVKDKIFEGDSTVESDCKILGGWCALDELVKDLNTPVEAPESETRRLDEV